MELGTEITQKVKKTIKKQLQTLGCYIDDELPEYIMMMIANKRTQEQMVDDLKLFLNGEADKFVTWLTVVLARIQKAMELPDIDAIVAGGEELPDLKKKSNKKVKKDKKLNETEEHKKDENNEKRKSGSGSEHEKVLKESLHERRKNYEEMRRPRDGKRDGEEKEKEKNRLEYTQGETGNEYNGKEKKDNDFGAGMDDSAEAGKESAVSREEEINKRRAAREKRDREERERREARRKKEQEEREKREKERHRRYKSRKSEERIRHEKAKEPPSDEKTNGVDNIRDKEISVDVRKEAENEAKKIESRESRNPMEFVKRIAKDIDRQILTEPVTEKESEETTAVNDGDGDVDFIKETVNSTDVTTSKTVCENVCENVSLQAVSQYEDKENDDKEKVETNEEKTDEKSESSSEKNRRRSSRSRSKSESRQHSRKESRSTKPSKSRSCERHKHVHSRLRSHSKEKEERKSKRSDERTLSGKDERIPDHNLMKARTQGEESSRRRRRSLDESKSQTSKRNDHKSGSSVRRSSRGSPVRRSSGDGSPVNKRRSRDHHRRRSSNETSTKVNKSIEDKAKDEDVEETPAKPTMASKVKVFTDFSRKPSLSKHKQASTVLLKRAVTEVVSKKLDEEYTNDGDDDVELDYNESNDEDESSGEDNNNEGFLERRVINFDKEKSGLTTITVNFDKENSPNKDEHSSRFNGRDQGRRDHGRVLTNERVHSRSSVHTSSYKRRSDDNDSERYTGISKNDARYTILQSRSEHDNSMIETKVHHKGRPENPSNRDRRLNSMVADIEEKSGRNKIMRRWSDQRNKQNGRQRESIRTQSESSGYEESKQCGAVDTQGDATKELPHFRPEEGDLRELLLGKREQKSSSDEEDALVQRLREKIKAEKHKRLFGKLNSDDRSKWSEDNEDRSKGREDGEDWSKRREERHSVHDRLNTKKKRRRLSENNNENGNEWIEKVTQSTKERVKQRNRHHSHSKETSPSLLAPTLPLPPDKEAPTLSLDDTMSLAPSDVSSPPRKEVLETNKNISKQSDDDSSHSTETSILADIPDKMSLSTGEIPLPS